MIDDRRIAPRRDVFRIGEIWAEGRLQPIDCLIRNSSAAGALIEVLKTDVVPDTFRLTMGWSGFDKQCHVVRRTTHMLGVAFAV